VASIVGVEPHVLRYWESEFRSVRPQKSARGQRIYSRRDVDTLLKVKELLYAHRFTIAGARRKLRDGGVEPPGQEAVGSVEDLRRVRDSLIELRKDACALLEDLAALADPGALPATRAAGGESVSVPRQEPRDGRSAGMRRMSERTTERGD
jgi:DNA-binding transcriptional MerR regulator